jgi:hypothetical protein
MKRLAGAIALAIAVAIAIAGPAQAKPKLTNQKFAVTFSGENGQDWVVKETDVEHEPNCTIGPGAYGQSEFLAKTRGTETATFLANRKVGVAFGRVPVEGFIRRFFTIGSEPPEDCKDVYYEQLSAHQDCSQVAQWNQRHPWYGADVAVQVAGGKAAVEVDVAHYTENVDELTFPYCPFAGVEETKVEGAAKIATKKLFSGKPVTVKFQGRHDFPAPENHEVEGLIEWQLTLKALKPKKRG